MKVGDLIRFGAGVEGIVVEIYIDTDTATVFDFRGYWWTVRQNETEIISEAQ